MRRGAVAEAPRACRVVSRLLTDDAGPQRELDDACPEWAFPKDAGRDEQGDGDAQGDQDDHLVIADPGPAGKRMVVEFPDPNCDGAMKSRKRASMGSARKALTDHCGTPPGSFNKGMLSGTATLKGVGFFDFLHAGDQAANGIELHPVVGVWNIDCERLPPA